MTGLELAMYCKYTTCEDCEYSEMCDEYMSIFQQYPCTLLNSVTWNSNLSSVTIMDAAIKCRTKKLCGGCNYYKEGKCIIRVNGNNPETLLCELFKEVNV